MQMFYDDSIDVCLKLTPTLPFDVRFLFALVI